jgi:hypothetical protein
MSSGSSTTITSAEVSGDTTSITTNGTFSETWTENGVENSMTAVFDNFSVVTVLTSDYSEDTINGTFSIDFTPDECSEGTFTIETEIAKKYDFLLGYTTQGKLVINGNTTVEYGSDGSITITVGGESTTYESEYALAQLCDFQTLDEETPPPAGETTDGEGVAGDSMTITSSSSGSNLECYTDLHVNYYSTTTPDAISELTWYIDFHQSDFCTSPEGITFEQALSIDADTVCDVGLDINGADVDSMSGGLEHFTATTLPTGYYVVSMNNYSCATDVTNDVTIQIGDSLFGPYNCTYTTFDYDQGTNPGGWCAVADLKVDSNGVQVLAHDTNLNLWHPEEIYYSPALSPNLSPEQRRQAR